MHAGKELPGMPAHDQEDAAERQQVCQERNSLKFKLENLPEKKRQLQSMPKFLWASVATLFMDADEETHNSLLRLTVPAERSGKGKWRWWLC